MKKSDAKSAQKARKRFSATGWAVVNEGVESLDRIVLIAVDTFRFTQKETRVAKRENWWAGPVRRVRITVEGNLTPKPEAMKF